MSEQAPSKADALRAMREAKYSAKSSEVGKPAPRMSTPSAARGKPIGANDMPSPETSGASESNSAIGRPAKSRDRVEGPTVKGKPRVAPCVETVPATTKRTRAPNGTFDRKAYQRDLMRKRRQAEKKS